MVRVEVDGTTWSDRIMIRPAGFETNVERVGAIFNSNPAWVNAMQNNIGTGVYELDEVESFLWQSMIADGQACYEVCEWRKEMLIGMFTYTEVRQRMLAPCLGSFVIDSSMQGYGYGREALSSAEVLLREEGWTEVMASIFTALQNARLFFELSGYDETERTVDQDNRECVLMAKRLVEFVG